MALAYDNSTWLDSDGVPGSRSLSHTATGTNLIAIIGVFFGGSGVTGATYNGVACTRIGSEFNGCTLFYIIAPPTGAQTVTVSVNASNNVLRILCATYTGAHQTTQPLPTSSTSGASPKTTTLSPGFDNGWMVAQMDSGGAPVAGTGAFKRSPDGFSHAYFDSNAVAPDPASMTLTFTGTASVVAAVIFPVGPTITKTESLTLTEILNKSFPLYFVEMLTLTEALVRLRAKVFTETMTLTDRFFKYFWKRRPVISTIWKDRPDPPQPLP